MRTFFKYFTISILIIIFISFIFFFFTDKGFNLRRLAAETVASTQHKDWARYLFLPYEKDELNKIINEIDNPKYENSINNINDLQKMNHITSKTNTTELVLKKLINEEININLKENENLEIKVETIKKRINPLYYYEGKIIYISNPQNVKLVSSESKNKGEKINLLAERNNAIASINASGFHDLNGMGNGGVPIGIIIENGQITNTSGGNNKKDFVAGLTEDGVLITGVFSPNELTNLGVKYAAGFKPQLIVNGKKMITDGEGGGGINPRTAIGQMADGTIVFLVIDGRQTHSIGATLKEVQDILFERGVINALCMDGGSSSVMYFNSEIITTPSSRSRTSRYLPNAWVVTADENTNIKLTYDNQPVEVK